MQLSPWRYLFWFILLIVLFFYLFRSFNTTNSVTISYTEFKNQVGDQNVVSVTIQGNTITGTLKKPYTPPSSSQASSTSSGESGAPKKSQAQSYKDFRTIKPDVTDPELLPLLEKNNVTINAEEQSTSWLPYILIMLVPWILILGFFLYTRRQMQGGGSMGGGLFSMGRSKAKRYRKTEGGITFKDVAGLENAKRDLLEIIDYLKNPGHFSSLGADIPNGVMLMGPPGTGKTLLSRATAGEAGVPFYSASGSEFIEMFVGVGASRVRDMFENAKKNAPSIIFIDEIDSVGRARGTGLGGGHDEREQTLNQILSEMDGFEAHQAVVVMAATNRPDVLDPALIRPGRFDRQITLDLPQRHAREKILQIHTRQVPLADGVDLDNLAARTVGFSGADLKNLVNEAALLAGRKEKKKVENEDFEEARDKILLGPEREEKMVEEEKEVVAYHESGHALMAKLLPDTDPLQKVTIIPRGRSLGATEQVPETDRYNLKRQYLMSRIAVALGGRAAELVVYGDVTNGAESDLKNVTRLARKMVCQWGMSEKLGPVAYRHGEEHPFLGREITQAKDFSEDTARLIDEEIQSIVKEMENRSVDMLKNNRDKLDALAHALLEHETLENEDVDRILGNIEKTA